MNHHHLFTAIVNITDFTPSESDMQEIIRAYEKDLKSLDIEARKHKFAESIGLYAGKYKREMLVEFYRYWSEHSDTGKKMRFEKEKVFNIKLRLERWLKNQKHHTNGTKKTGHDIGEAMEQARQILLG